MTAFRVSLILALQPIAALAHNGGYDGSNNPRSDAPYFYSSEITSFDDTPPEADDMIFNFVADTDGGDCSDSVASVVASSLVYDNEDGGSCLVSSAIYGGNNPFDDLFDLFESDDEFSEDDDDDDDDDGHSSMLSNSHLSRSRASATGSTEQWKSRQSHSKSSTKAVVNLYTGFKSNINTMEIMTLRIRGGEVTSSVGSELVKKLIVSAIVTLAFEAIIGHPLEFFTIVMQTSPAGTTYGKVFNDITNQKGITGLWDGFIPWGVLQAVLKGGVFGLAHASASKVLLPLADKGTIPVQLAKTIAGGIGGGFQGFVLSPTLLMKTRVMTNPVFRESMALWKATWLSFSIGYQVAKNEGFMTLMKGADIFATKRVFDWSTRYYFSDLFESIFVGIKGDPLTTLEKSMSSLLGGVASTILTLPLDVLVAKTQDAKKAGVAVAPFKLLVDEINELGLGGVRDAYLRGFEARLAHVCLTTVVLKTGAPVVYDALFGKST